MLQRIREQIGTAGLVVAMVALVAALAGGAVAATGGDPFSGSSAKRAKGLTKAQVLALIKEHGVPGEPGAPGAGGTPGKDGVDGTNGADGKDGVDGGGGVDGVSVIGSSLDPGEGGCTEGGVEYTAVNSVDIVCDGHIGKDGKEGKDGKDGVDGSPWAVGGVLPPGAMETGVWNMAYTGEIGVASLSFPIPLPQELPGSKVHYIEPGQQGVLGECSDAAQTEAGTVANPLASPGHLCVYGRVEGGGIFPLIRKPSDPVPTFETLESTGAGRSGAVLMLLIGSEFAYGTFAVTAPNA
jgi:hypothetical protein